MNARKPEAHRVDETGWVVHGTWDIELAERLVAKDDPEEARHLPPPVTTWLRTRPASRGDQEEYGYSCWYCRPRVPGERGAFKAVEFPEPLFTGQKRVFPMGLPAAPAQPVEHAHANEGEQADD